MWKGSCDSALGAKVAWVDVRLPLARGRFMFKDDIAD